MEKIQFAGSTRGKRWRKKNCQRNSINTLLINEQETYRNHHKAINSSRTKSKHTQGMNGRNVSQVFPRFPIRKLESNRKSCASLSFASSVCIHCHKRSLKEKNANAFRGRRAGTENAPRVCLIIVWLRGKKQQKNGIVGPYFIYAVKFHVHEFHAERDTSHSHQMRHTIVCAYLYT